MNSLAPLIPVAIIVAVAAFVGGLFWWEKQAKAKRREEMATIAAGLGFEFLDAAPLWLSETLGLLPLFSKGHSKELAAAMSGRVADFSVRLFDYRYTIGSGKNARTHRQTVAAFRVLASRVPNFECRPENLFHKIGHMFGYQDFNFAEHPVFSKHYLLRGEDEPAVRRLFNEEVLSHLDNDSGWSIEGAGEWVIFFRTNYRPRGGDVAAFFQKAADLFIKFGVE